MKNSMTQTIMLFLLSMLHISKAMDPIYDENTKTSRAQNKIFNHRPGGGLIAFNTEEEKFRIDWSVTIPFISIPVDHKIGHHGEVPPLLHVNTKTLGAVGLLTTLFTVLTPLLSKNHHHANYRSGDGVQWSQMGSAINEMLFGNNYVAPCMQRVVCSIVSVSAHSDNPTSTDKIIDGLSRWFKDATNGTIIQDAVNAGRKGNRDCSLIYKDCLITPKLLKTMMNEFGIA